MTMLARIGALALLLVLANITADAQNICCSGGGGGSVTYPLAAPNGTAGAPSYSFTNGLDSGVYANANGSVTIAGSKPASATGGSIALAAGTPGTLGSGGALSLAAGNGTGNAAVGGAVALTGGSGGSGGGSAGGAITIAGGLAGATAGGAVTISGGAANATGGSAGAVNINGGAAFSGSSTAGGINIAAAAGSPTVSGANAGASVNITAGNGGSGATSNGGNIVFTPGTANSGGTPGSTLAAAGAGSGQFHVGGLINATVTSTGNGADTTEDTLQTYTLPASSLDIAGRCIRVTSWGTTANNADAKTLRLRFGGTLIYSQTLTTSILGDWVMKATICKTAANTQTAYAEGLNAAALGTASPGIDVTAPAETDTATIIIKTTGQAGTANANDIICTAQLVEFLS